MIPRSVLHPVRAYWARRLRLVDLELAWHTHRTVELRREACAIQERLDLLNAYGRPVPVLVPLALPESRWRR